MVLLRRARVSPRDPFPEEMLVLRVMKTTGMLLAKGTSSPRVCDEDAAGATIDALSVSSASSKAPALGFVESTRPRALERFRCLPRNRDA